MNSRRNFLRKGLAATGCVFTFQTVEASNVSMTEVFEKGLNKRSEQSWKIDQWYDYIDQTDINYGNTHQNVESESVKKSSGDISTDVISKYEPSNLTLVMTTYDINSYQALEIYWKFENSVDSIDSGQPNDLIKIGYSDDHFSKASEKDGQDWVYFGDDNYVSPANHEAMTPMGVVAAYNGPWMDYQSPLIGDYVEKKGDKDGHDYFGVYVDPNKSIPEQEREIFFTYSMLYDSAELGGISLSSNGVSFTIKEEQDSWSVPVAYEQSDIRNGKTYNP